MRALLLSLPLLSFFGLSGIHAQQAAPVAYAGEPLVIERADLTYRMQADGTGVEEKTVEVRVQTESALKQLAVLSVPFAANSEHVEWVYARLLHKDGSVTETPVAGAIEIAEAVTREAPFYSDLKEMQLPLKDLRVGDKLQWKARIVRTKAEAANQFWGQETFVRDAVVLEQSLELDVPKDQSVNVWSPKSKPVETTAGDRHIYRWTSENKKPTVGLEATAAAEAEKKRVRTADEELDDRLGKLPDVAWTTFKSWEAVGAWYRGLEGERMMPDADIKAKVAQLTAGKTTDREKVEAVYSYVAMQIHYIGVAFGVGRYQPHSAGDVLGNQYGDCKDKHTLLAAMLGALGMHPDAVLIGVGIRFNQSMPSPAAFNHLITRVELDGKPVWLDTTAEVAPFGMLIAQTRDHDALEIPGSGPAEVVRTPARPPFADVSTMQAKGSLDADGLSNSRLTMTFRGDVEMLVRAVLRQVSPAQYDQIAQQICAGMGYGGTASHMEVSRIDDTTQPLTMSFDYKRSKAGDWDNLRTVPQLSPAALPRPDEKEPPVEAIELGSVRTEESNSEMKLPEGWGAELPEAVHAKSTWATYDETYRFEKGTLYAQRKVEVLAERVPQAQWKEYSKFAEKAGLGGDAFVQLTRKPGTFNAGSVSGGEAGDDAGAAIAYNADAAKLIKDAHDALRKHDTKTAGPLLDQARALNATQSGLWSGYGYLSIQQGELSAGVADYQKELKLHPESLGVYSALIAGQLAQGKRKDAEASLRYWGEAAPHSAEPPLQLATMQLEDGSPMDAVATASAAIAMTPADEAPDDRLRLMLGRAQMKAGTRDKGRETLVALLKVTDDSNLMNDAAYELADAGVELPLAEETTRKALTSLEEESRTWTLDENSATLRSKTSLIQATWDTMGWVLFREGKNDEAEGYVKASWTGRQSAEVGKHLAQIALAKGDKNAALMYYELAIAASPTYDALGVRKEPNAMQKEMMAQADKLRKAGAHGVTGDAAQALQKVRTLSLGAGENGYADYKLLINAQGVVRAEPSGDKTLPDALGRMKKAKVSGFFPPGSGAQLVLARILNCHQDVCELVAMQ